MAIRVVEIHHPALRIGDDREAAHAFYNGVLGLEADTGRPEFPGIPGFWMNVGEVGQIHLIGGAQPSPLAKARDKDPAAAHVALAVADVIEAKADLDERGITYWSIPGKAGPHGDQLFLRDPFGNMIELHQFDQCRCRAAKRTA